MLESLKCEMVEMRYIVCVEDLFKFLVSHEHTSWTKER